MAFHRPSGEHGGWPLQGTSPLFWTSKVLTALPMLTVLMAFVEYRTRILLGRSRGLLGDAVSAFLQWDQTNDEKLVTCVLRKIQGLIAGMAQQEGNWAPSAQAPILQAKEEEESEPTEKPANPAD